MEDRIYKYFHGGLKREERLELLREAETDKELRKELIRQHNMLALFELAQQKGDAETALAEYKRFLRVRKYNNMRRLRSAVLRYAAVAAAAAALTWFVADFYPERVLNLVRVSADDMQELNVPAGQRISFMLQDGTMVWLNAQSTIRYPLAFDRRERRINIDGEAYIEVAPDENRPLTVFLKGVEVKALGTTFNVRAYEDESDAVVSLLQGKVSVRSLNNESEIILRPNQQATVSGDGIRVTAITHPDYFLWKDGIYSFTNEPFESIAEKLELYYDVDITFNDDIIRKWKYTVKFRQRESINEIMRLMQRIHKFGFIKDEENNLFTITK
ncbi:MAG: FecR domain-containing protein [Tannerella sp.]|jgi:ferric-dicitrate binding protein FerR (iron transport regulator)|nr:FecR domain-containing protein [Tannerella sp.]